jgi:hypothetical protein
MLLKPVHANVSLPSRIGQQSGNHGTHLNIFLNLNIGSYRSFEPSRSSRISSGMPGLGTRPYGT